MPGMNDATPTVLSSVLEDAARPALEALAAHDAVRARCDADPELLERARHACAASGFVCRMFERHPEWLLDLADDGSLARSPTRDALAEAFRWSGDADTDAGLARLRIARNRALLATAWRDLNGLATLPQTLADLSAAADAAITAAVDGCREGLVARHGEPRGPDGAAQPFIVLGMGKLGGGELNFSSDVDLVFLYPEPGETDGDRPVDNETFFIRLGQRVVRALDAATADGFVYRVDMRLRPFGASGPLAIGFDAFENYLQQHGRDWERYAYVKARAITSADAALPVFEQVLRPFVFRRYLDFGVFNSLRDMKRLIREEVARRELDNNIKLGAGGIREIEFIVQSFQLVRGGHDPTLRSPSLLEVLPRLASRRLLGSGPVEELTDAYAFLRTLENRLQMLDDRQRHELPDDAFERERLCHAMDVEDWDALVARLDAHRAHVQCHFGDTVFGQADDDSTTPAPDGDDVSAAWLTPDADDAPALLVACGMDDEAAASICRRVAALRASNLHQRMDEVSRQRLDAVMPALLAALCPVENAGETFERVIAIIEAIARRSAYLALLRENPPALARLLDICSRSRFLAIQLATWPLLLDELLDERLLNEEPDRAGLAADLSFRLDAAPADDLEARLNALREFQRVGTFRIAIADITGSMPLMRVSDRLTDIAEFTLELATDMAWDELVARHGRPRCQWQDGEARDVRFGIIGYGKLGGLELGYGSDLDLVFVHDGEGDDGETDGAQPLANAMFFARLARRIIHFLSIQTTSGRLYEVDTRLRPSGQSGLLVTSLDAMERYQRDEAWTWEHQALLRARAVAGHDTVHARFVAMRERVLTEAVRRDTLRAQVAEMRARMRRELGRGDAARFDIKQDEGGLADIEFLVQYLVLEHAASHPALLEYSDNIRQLESLAAAGVLGSDVAGHAAEVYRRYRGELHAQSLADGAGLVPADAFEDERDWVRARWAEVFG